MNIKSHDQLYSSVFYLYKIILRDDDNLNWRYSKDFIVKNCNCML